MSSAPREAEQIACGTWKLVKRQPWAASCRTFGVSYEGVPKGRKSENPESSRKITTMLGGREPSPIEAQDGVNPATAHRPATLRNPRRDASCFTGRSSLDMGTLTLGVGGTPQLTHVGHAARSSGPRLRVLALQIFQLTVNAVIFAVGYLRGVLDIVKAVVAPDDVP